MALPRVNGKAGAISVASLASVLALAGGVVRDRMRLGEELAALQQKLEAAVSSPEVQARRVAELEARVLAQERWASQHDGFANTRSAELGARLDRMERDLDALRNRMLDRRQASAPAPLAVGPRLEP